MKLIHNPSKNIGLKICAAIGIFDGVHIGHKSIIQLVKQSADADNLSSCLITFNPHPQEVITGKELPLIVPFNERVKLLENETLDITVCFSFTKEFSGLSAETFITDILVGRLNLKKLFVGPDFVFGRNRGGNTELLYNLGKKLGFETKSVSQVTKNGHPVSSTEIRNLISEGKIEKVNEYLGRTYSIEGKVTEGEKRGRILGFPTTNLDTEWKFLPRDGVYITNAVVSGTRHQSITNIGYRPTFGNNGLLIETHIFDFGDNLYGKNIRIEFLKRLRNEKKFSGIEELKSAISLDVQNARKYFDGIQVGET